MKTVLSNVDRCRVEAESGGVMCFRGKGPSINSLLTGCVQSLSIPEALKPQP